MPAPAAPPSYRAGRAAPSKSQPATHGGVAGRTYDWPRINNARDEAFALLAQTLTGHPADDADPGTAKERHRDAIDRWSAEPGRTAADAASAFREAAARADHDLF